MAMVGLFWITEESVHLGSPPDAEEHYVRITSEGVQARDGDGTRAWPWSGLRSAVVEAAPVEGEAGGGGRFLAAVLEAVVTLGSSYGGGTPPQMLLVLESDDGTEEVRVWAAAKGYTSQEIALSQRLLTRFREGAADPGTLMAWSRDHGGTPRPPEREALLREWVGTQNPGTEDGVQR
ncbi:hypothetical protein [Streptomyces erythrochromogenes]|uniref:hypothetical protein n=1 Tax=Streptomyces erythrochromogenes TaxID=285574 RepID=UPI00225A708A|nr:hypothetical protein [Streptomyces erythrochromogenes]MCX5588877.1 hypothetical protein [Streptomyces erythrochromogenes]